MSIRTKARILRSNQTPAEVAFWELVRRKTYRGLHFGRQHIVRHFGEHTGNDHYIVDFYCAKYKLCVEIDGGVHDDQVKYDEARTQTLEELGYRVVRFRNAFVLEEGREAVHRELDSVILEIDASRGR